MAGRKQNPVVIEMPSQKMATVRTVGDPGTVGGQAFSALYGAVYTLKFDLKKRGIEYKIGPPRARWPNAHTQSREEWIGVWGIPVPEDTNTLAQKVPDVRVMLETWEYDTVAEVLHIGPYSEEGPTVHRLHEFIAASGYEIAGPHEEEYLTRPTAKVQKTVIRYQVRQRA